MAHVPPAALDRRPRRRLVTQQVDTPIARAIGSTLIGEKEFLIYREGAKKLAESRLQSGVFAVVSDEVLAAPVGTYTSGWTFKPFVKLYIRAVAGSIIYYPSSLTPTAGIGNLLSIQPFLAAGQPFTLSPGLFTTGVSGALLTATLEFYQGVERQGAVNHFREKIALEAQSEYLFTLASSERAWPAGDRLISRFQVFWEIA